MRKVALLWLGAALLALAPAPAVQAHSLTKKKARAALKPVATEIAPTFAPAIAAKLPGATIAKSTVGLCEIVKKGTAPSARSSSPFRARPRARPNVRSTRACSSRTRSHGS